LMVILIEDFIFSLEFRWFTSINRGEKRV